MTDENVKEILARIIKHTRSDGDFYSSGKSVIIDQMIQYASLRKSKIGSYKSFKLDNSR